MISKRHKNNTNFQIAYFVAGSCHTADSAYFLLKDLRDERQTAIDAYDVATLRTKAEEIKAKRLFESDDITDKLEGEARLLEIENARKTSRILHLAALDELEFIDKAIKVIEPQRIYKDKPDLEAAELAQYEEWKLELIRRAENEMICNQGRISTDQFATMRLHPAFKSEILPRIMEVQELLSSPDGVKELQGQMEGSQFKEINNLLLN